MNVKQLISELKKMPQNLRVGVSFHDNGENEVASWVMDVSEILQDKSEFTGLEDESVERCVVLRC